MGVKTSKFSWVAKGEPQLLSFQLLRGSPGAPSSRPENAALPLPTRRQPRGRAPSLNWEQLLVEEEEVKGEAARGGEAARRGEEVSRSGMCRGPLSNVNHCFLFETTFLRPAAGPASSIAPR